MKIDRFLSGKGIRFSWTVLGEQKEILFAILERFWWLKLLVAVQLHPVVSLESNNPCGNTKMVDTVYVLVNKPLSFQLALYKFRTYHYDYSVIVN